MAEDVKDDVTEIPTKRRKLDSDESDLSIQQECTSSNISATEKLVSLGGLPSTSTDNGPNHEDDLEKLPDQSDGKNGDDSDSDVSDISGLSETAWKSSPGTMAWIHEQMMLGQNPRVILKDLISKDTDIDHLDDYALWEIIIHLLSEPPKRDRLEEYHTLDHAIQLIKSCQKIVVLTGAGVSVSCGIPDFRSRNGIYARLAVDFPNLPDPQAMFDINFFLKDQRPFFKFAKEIYPGQFEPSKSHKFIRLVETHGKLLRNYTQNIDTLEQVAGIQNVIQCHGSFATATCMACKHKVSADEVREDIFNQVIPKCPVCSDQNELGIMKPDIVFFGESLPEEFHQQMAEDKQNCDLLIVIGSSLKVRPVALIPNSLPQNVPQILINREPLKHLNFDIELLGDCDVIISELCKRLDDGYQVLSDSSPIMTEISRQELRTPSPISSPTKDLPAETTSADSSADKQKETPIADPVCGDQEEKEVDTKQPSVSAEALENKPENMDKTDSGPSENAACKDDVNVPSENAACKDGMNESNAASSSQCLESNDEQPTVDKEDTNGDLPCDSTTTENQTSLWHPQKVSLAKYLEDGQYIYLPPNRYAFPGAEVYSDVESDEEDNFRNYINMSGSSNCSSLNSEDDIGQSSEQDEDLDRQASDQDVTEQGCEDSTGEDRISSTDTDHPQPRVISPGPASNDNECSSPSDSKPGGGSSSREEHSGVQSDVQPGGGSNIREEEDSGVKSDVQSVPKSGAGDVILPDSSSSSM